MSLPKAYALVGGSVLWLIVVGLISVLLHPNEIGMLVFQIACGGFVLLFLAGMAVWAGAKGWHPIVGILLGLFCSLVGLAILLFLPDKSASRDKNINSASSQTYKRAP